jgi:hypothetical protein
MRARFAAIAESLGIPSMAMASGAGHDAAVFANLGVPAGMLFVRNAHGSHNPDESMAIADFAAASRKEHHSLWLDQEAARTGPNRSQRQPAATPGE